MWWRKLKTAYWHYAYRTCPGTLATPSFIRSYFGISNTFVIPSCTPSLRIPMQPPNKVGAGRVTVPPESLDGVTMTMYSSSSDREVHGRRSKLYH